MLREIVPFLKLPIKAKVDCRSLVEAVYSTHSVEEKLLRIDMASIKQIVEQESIAVSWILHEEQLADSLAKRGANGENLAVLQTGRFQSSL